MRSYRLFFAIMVATVFVAMPLMLNGQQLKEQLFADAEQTMAAAKNARADLLAPKSYGKALEHYQKAEKLFNKEESIDDIRRELRQTVEYLKKALEATKLAEVTLTATIQARGDATGGISSQLFRERMD